jgi:hypothetical protein
MDTSKELTDNEPMDNHDNITIYDIYSDRIGYHVYGGYRKIEDVEESITNSLINNLNLEEKTYINNNIYILIKILIPISVMVSLCIIFYWFYK